VGQSDGRTGDRSILPAVQIRIQENPQGHTLGYGDGIAFTDNADFSNISEQYDTAVD
jgi:hypothetical protein